jgi:hypothetical protein
MHGNARGSNRERELKDGLLVAKGAVVPLMEIIPPIGCIYSQGITFG